MMVWQDYVLTAAIIVFAISLIPQVYYGFKKKRGLITKRSSIPTFIGLVVIAVTYFTLNLYFSALMSLLVAFLWFLLILQRLVYEKV